MPKIEPFEEHTQRYEDWFEKNPFAYQAELEAVRMLLPEKGVGFEIGVGSGRFSKPLGIGFGIDPSRKMSQIARSRGIATVKGIAEELPLKTSLFDFALMVTTICFLDDAKVAIKEASRVLKPRGSLIIGFVDRESLIGRLYQKHKNESVFYRPARFFSVPEVIALLEKTGFTDFKFTQTIFHTLPAIDKLEPIKEGFGEGSFVVIRGVKR